MKPMIQPRFMKLIDIHDQAERLHKALEKFLEAHSILWKRQHFKNDGFFRYLVRRQDLCCAQAVLPALRDLAARPPK